MGRAAGPAALPQPGGRVLSAGAGPGHAADVFGEHGGRCHEGDGGAEGRVPVQPVGRGAPHCGGAAPPAQMGDEGLFVGDPAVQCLYLPDEYSPSAARQRAAAQALAVAGGSGAGGTGLSGGGRGPAHSAGGVAGQREHAHPAGGALRGRLWHGGSLPCRAVAAGAGRRGAGYPADRKIPQGAAEKPGESELFWTQGGELSIIQWILWRNRRMGLWPLWPATPGKTGADRSRPDAKEDFCEENKEACAAGVAAPDDPGAAGRGHRDIQLLLCPAAPGRRRGGGQLVAPQPCPALPEPALDRGALPAQLSGGRAVPCALEVCRGA